MGKKIDLFKQIYLWGQFCLEVPSFAERAKLLYLFTD